MILILGGGSSGRHAFFESLNLSPASCYTVTAGDVRAFAGEQRKCGSVPFCPQLSPVCTQIASWPVVIATEMGLGLIPMDADRRMEREQNGRLNIALAFLADCVVLMVAGIPRVIKGDLSAVRKKTPWLIVFRHGATQGNLERRYAGAATDEDLCGEGKEQVLRTKEKLSALASRHSPAVREGLLHPKKVYVSPMKRARQTAEILFPDAPLCTVCGFAEMDFGLFEGKTSAELLANPDTRDAYQAFIDSGAQMHCPPSEKTAGESAAGFRARVADAFGRILAEHSAFDLASGAASGSASGAASGSAGGGEDVIVVVGHGGTQMALFSQFAAHPLSEWNERVEPYFSWQTECADFRLGELRISE